MIFVREKQTKIFYSPSVFLTPFPKSVCQGFRRLFVRLGDEDGSGDEGQGEEHERDGKRVLHLRAAAKATVDRRVRVLRLFEAIARRRVVRAHVRLGRLRRNRRRGEASEQAGSRSTAALHRGRLADNLWGVL